MANSQVWPFQGKLEPIPEFSLAIAACTWPPSPIRSARVLAALNRQIDWQHFLRVVSRHRIAGLVHHALREGTIQAALPVEVKASLRESADRYTRDALLAAIQAVRISKAIGAEGISAAILKGIPLAIQAYGNLGIRHCKDIDVLVSHGDIPHTHEILISLGYQRRVPAPSSDARDIAFYMRHRFHFEYVDPRSGQQVELHWRLGNSPELGLGEYASHRWSILPLGAGMQVHTLVGDDLLTYLCVHGAKHAWYRLKWLADVAALLSQDSGAASRLLQRSAAQGSIMPARQALSLCHAFWGQSLPPEMMHSTWREKTLTRMAYAAMTAQKAAAEMNEERFASTRISFSRFLLSRNPRFWLREAVNMMMPLAAWEEGSTVKRILHLLVRPPLWIARKLRLNPNHSA